MKRYDILLLACAFWACDDTATRTSDTLGGNCSEAARTADTPLESPAGMALIPAGCRNYTAPGSPYKPGYEYACVGTFWLDTVETSIQEYQKLMGPVEAVLHSSNPTSSTYCLSCPMDDLTYFEAILYANARTKATMSPSDTVYSYASITKASVSNRLISPAKSTEVTDLVGLVADTTRKGFRLPSRHQLAWAAVQDAEDTVGYQWIKGNSGGTTHPVGTLLHNPFGIHDWAGNVWEWTTDIDSVNVGIGTPIWEVNHVAIGGSYAETPSATDDYRGPYSIQNETHAGVRLLRSTSTSSASVSSRPCR